MITILLVLIAVIVIIALDDSGKFLDLLISIFYALSVAAAGVVLFSAILIIRG